MQAIEKLYSSAMRIAAPAFIQDPLTLDVIVNAPALTRTLAQWPHWPWQRRRAINNRNSGRQAA